jgi:3-hydroxyisobutyrate dehydrogenase
MSSEAVGLIGLGAVGTGLALVLADAGYDLMVADARPRSDFTALFKAGGGRLTWSTAEALAQQCTVVITSLPSVAIIATVAEKILLPNMRRGTTWVDTSTTDETEVKRLGPLCAKHGISLLECPLTGGVHLVRSGDMTMLVGGDERVMKKHWKLLNTVAGKVIHTGAHGTASVVKVISNMLAALHLVGVGEAFMLGKKSGIALPALWDALKASAGNSYVLETEGPFIMNGTFDTDFSLQLHCKDLDIGYKMARALKTPLVLHGCAQQVYERARARYGDQAPSSMPAKLMEEDCGVKLQAPGYDGFTYQDRTSNWDRPLKGGRWKPRSKL